MMRSSLETYITIIGLIAAALSSGSLFPQLLKVCRTKSTKDISVRMYALLTAGIFLWLIYGLLSGDIPIILANFIGFIQALSIYILKMKYK